jgi:fructose-specific phosphotransferase system IIC component
MFALKIVCGRDCVVLNAMFAYSTGGRDGLLCVFAGTGMAETVIMIEALFWERAVVTE